MNTKLTPMLRQYLDIKKKHQGEILFFRMGDFYEMFFEDAHTASEILSIALTKRQNDVPMCGLPFHAAEAYIARLIRAGHKVAICEQLETVPSEGTIVKREVVRIITPGTLLEDNLLQSDDNNFLASIVIDKEKIGLAFVDISTGDFYLSAISKSYDIFRGELVRFNPREIILKESGLPEDEKLITYIKNKELTLNRINEWLYDKDYLINTIKEVFGLANLKGIGIEDDIEIYAAGSILEYLKNTQRQSINHLKIPRRVLSNQFMLMDDATINNLELTTNQQDRSRKRTLFSVLNYTKTPMGRRFMERAILQPLLSQIEIDKRLDIVQFFTEYYELTEETSADLKNIQDVERLVSRFSIGKTFPKNYLAISGSIDSSLNLKKLLKDQPSDKLTRLIEKIPQLNSLSNQIKNTIMEEPALTPEQGRIIKEGFNSELDHLYSLKKDGRDWIISYQEEEKKRLNIPTLKIKYNRIHGYYIEVSKGQVGKVPENYLRKQTLVNAERYTTEKLQKFESDILSATDKIVDIEKKEIEKLLHEILKNKDKLQQLAAAVGEIDFFISLAIAARNNNFIRPQISTDGSMNIREGRHPIVEKYYTAEVFIPNDIIFNSKENLIKIITGPNMAGKSTYIRMAAIIQLMGQVGSFVPAEEAILPVVDRIFTRIGASDNISRGESTFLVEMNETATILNHATDKSLIIMDEVGRGTSTYDGLSLAWAIVEYIINSLKAKTLFATHYHELTALGNRKLINNYNVLVKENIDGVDFLHKVVPGSADKSYGIHVAKLAGIPKEITGKAQKILNKLESKKKSINIDDNNDQNKTEQMELFNAANHLVIKAIKSIDLDGVTPIDALNELNRLKKLIED